MKLFVIDDHQVLRVGIRDFLGSIPGYELVGESGSARAALPLIGALRPDVVLMDIAMPGMDGVVAAREILRRWPNIRIVVLSAHGQVQDVVDAVNAGVIGFVLKTDPLETLRQALDHAARGASYIPPSLRAGISAAKAAPAGGDVLGVLSEREREIFRLAADCSTATEIATALCIARKTVDTHLNRISRKLGLHGRAQLVRLAVSMGLVHSVRTRAGAQRRRASGP